VSFLKELHRLYPNLAQVAYAIPNAARRNVRQGKWLKYEGLKAGVWDICIPYPRYNPIHQQFCPGFYIEFKIAPNKLTDKQKEWGQKMIRLGWLLVVCYQLEDAISFINHYLKTFPESISTTSLISV